ncbi:hypothetical protein SI65_05212 [Aspergillus cristatus]|uniref:Uncharacterized protein n=1 Tax=Aspergillus cristatus TaxID=573508 RepID=A0A1E3BC99_ASPCR|nr:hypothetical protein SI65_05212 [Aspergillus cristatus]
MGYTHYYNIQNWDSPEWTRAWPQLIHDVPSIISAANIPLQREDPTLTTTPADAEDTTDEEIPPQPPLVDINKGIKLNGAEDQGFEDLILARGSPKWFVKTNRRPYDKVVACVLLRAYMLAPGQFRLRSDGFWDYEDEWGVVRELYEKIWPGEEIRRPWREEEDDGVGEADDVEGSDFMG